MRLGQLSRKLSVRVNDILEFLSTKNIPLENDSNARLDDEHVKLIVQHFAPELSHSTSTPEMPLEQDLSETDDQENSSSSQTFDGKPADTETEEKPVEEIHDDVIKVPKIELSGLKILGKIDLPERKKKEASDLEQPGQQDTNTDNKKRVDRRGGSQRNEVQNTRRKNPIALQREREAQEAEEKRQERAIQQKEQRTQNYLKRVKMAVPTKSARLLAEPTEELSKTDDTPMTFFGRLLRWLKR